jgi:hypothetical protein
MKTCTICKGSIAYPEIQGKTHFVCDGRVPAKNTTHSSKGMIASQSSADARWTRIEQNQVDAAIAHVAKTKGIFTADDVWQHLGADFPVTKGLAGRLNAACGVALSATQANWHMRTAVARMTMHSA